MIPGVTVDLTSGLGGWITDLAKNGAMRSRTAAIPSM